MFKTKVKMKKGVQKSTNAGSIPPAANENPQGIRGNTQTLVTRVSALKWGAAVLEHVPDVPPARALTIGKMFADRSLQKLKQTLPKGTSSKK
jgi:hypothetical protein